MGVGLDELWWSLGGGFNGFRGLGVWTSFVPVNVEYETFKCKIV